MNKELKATLEQSADNHSAPINPSCEYQARKSFIEGAEWLHYHGYQFTKEDMIEFASYAEYSKKGLGFEDEIEAWLKERGKQ